MGQENVELRRHIDKWLEEWKNRPDHKPALIKGIRQSGKTHSIKEFVKKNYDVVVYLNFWDTPSLIDAFYGDLRIDNIVKELSVKMPMPNIISGKTVFIFDEVQECPRALLSFKTNAADKRYDFIASGSYLGVKGYIIGDETPKPVGYVDQFDMRTLDFEEFLWAKGLKETQVNYLLEAFDSKASLSKSMHGSFTSLFKEYLCVGGFPEAVKNFVFTGNIYSSIQITRRIVLDLQNDFGRRRGKDKKPLFSQNEVARVRSAFALVPSFLGKENKRFIVSKIEGKGAKDAAKDAIDYLVDTGVVLKVHNLDVPSIPLSVNVIANQFKLFPTDIGMLVSMLEDGTSEAIMKGNMGIGKGMLYEALVAEALYKRGGKLFYYAKESGLKLDFVVNIDGESTILEVKAVDGNAKSAKTVLLHPEHYGKTKLVKITGGNLTFADGILTIPHYMAFLLFPWSPNLPVE